MAWLESCIRCQCVPWRIDTGYLGQMYKCTSGARAALRPALLRQVGWQEGSCELSGVSELSLGWQTTAGQDGQCHGWARSGSQQKEPTCAGVDVCWMRGEARVKNCMGEPGTLLGGWSVWGASQLWCCSDSGPSIMTMANFSVLGHLELTRRVTLKGKTCELRRRVTLKGKNMN